MFLWTDTDTIKIKLKLSNPKRDYLCPFRPPPLEPEFSALWLSPPSTGSVFTISERTVGKENIPCCIIIPTEHDDFFDWELLP